MPGNPSFEISNKGDFEIKDWPLSLDKTSLNTVSFPCDYPSGNAFQKTKIYLKLFVIAYFCSRTGAMPHKGNIFLFPMFPSVPEFAEWYSHMAPLRKSFRVPEKAGGFWMGFETKLVLHQALLSKVLYWRTGTETSPSSL